MPRDRAFLTTASNPKRGQPGMRRLISRIVALSVIAILPLVLTLARAQQPKAAPTSGIPEKAPGGMSQSDWNTIRGRCLQLSAEASRRMHMSPEQLKQIGPFSRRDLEDLEMCTHMVVPPMGTASPPPGRSIRMPPPPPPLRLQILTHRRTHWPPRPAGLRWVHSSKLLAHRPCPHAPRHSRRMSPPMSLPLKTTRPGKTLSS